MSATSGGGCVRLAGSRAVSNAIMEAAEVLKAGGVVGHEAEGVWGLACDPYNQAAVDNLLRLKSRPLAKGLILIGASAQAFDPWLQALPEASGAAVRRSWPGAVTWILPDPNDLAPNRIRGETQTLAARVPGRDELRTLCATFGGLLISTSANLSGESPALTRTEVEHSFGSELGYLLPASEERLSGKASTIINAANLETIRP